MKLIIHENSDITETEITIDCKEIDERLQKLVRQIKQYTYLFPVRTECGQSLLSAEDVYYIDSVDSNTFIYTEKEVYSSQETLSELENKLIDSTFVRISKSCILNTAFLKSVQPLWNSRLEAFLMNEEKLIISRHYVKNIREKING
ncbi:LytTR family DNA-binding domain-containing protein [Clostridium merdae]|uniref:LytTR family DNA-binding domain-containing protein n=1 Tax=Clostridium merdae TaxID=1958780 RepID=UPI000A26D7D1|nr:LytTR family DNA-binding domain-containing protein [Clostridium merdae]